LKYKKKIATDFQELRIKMEKNVFPKNMVPDIVPTKKSKTNGKTIQPKISEKFKKDEDTFSAKP
jgi:hypothetical protein